MSTKAQSPSMNYVGSITILDRGDAPAQAVLDRNARSLAKRVADETKEELGKVMKRVEGIYGTYEWSQQIATKNTDLEYVNDLLELEDLIKDPVKMKKYQKQVTIFIVGYENVCGQKLRLLQQVNEFFMENATKIDDDDAQVKTPDIELDDMMDTIDDTLKRTEDLATKLGDLNKEMVNYMYEYAQAKASTKSKKKLEKSLQQAKDDVLSLNEKLVNLQQELEEKEDRLQQMFKQIEVKNMEAQRYKTAAEVAKKSAEEADSLRELLSERDKEIRKLNKEIDRMSIELGESGVDNALKESRLARAAADSNSKLNDLQSMLENQQVNMEDAKRELQRLHEKQIEDMSMAHRQEIEELKNQHMEEVKRLLEELDELKEKLNSLLTTNYEEVEKLRSEADDAKRDATLRAASAEDAKRRLDEITVERDYAQAEVAKKEAETQDLIQQANELREELEKKPEVVIQEVIKEVEKEVIVRKSKTPSSVPGTPAAHPPPKSADSKKDITLVTELPDLNELEAAREESEAKVKIKEEEDGDEEDTKTITRQSSKTKTEDIVENFDDAFELDDEESWANVPSSHVPGRFLQFRQLTRQKLEELENKLEGTVKKTTKKVHTLKAQFHEHKKRWESERVVLIEQIEQATKLHGEAEREADIAMSQLEDFINEQELLEEEEEQKRSALERQSREPTMSLAEAEKNLQRTLEASGNSTVVEESMEERLLSQTDDAKVQEQAKEISRRTTEVEQEDQKLSGESPEDLRESVSRSRASLREQHKSALSQLKTSSDERKSKSPLLDASLLTKSELDDMEVDENGDMPFPPDNTTVVSLHEKGTSPFSFTRSAKSEKPIPMAEHPIVQEFVKTYQSVIKFKENLSVLFMDKEMMSIGQILAEIEPIGFDDKETIQPQIEEMATNILNILEEVIQITNTVLASERDYNVSSLLGTLSRDPTRSLMVTREKVGPPPTVEPPFESVHEVSQQAVQETNRRLEELLAKYEELQTRFREDADKHEKQLNHNTVVMMEMQDTIHNLQREVSTLGHKADNINTQPARTESPPIMFTRLDSERNAKVMKRAVYEHRLDAEKYTNAVTAMDKYVDIPAKRLAHLVNKYTHHQQMKGIEDSVRQSSNLDEDVFQVLDKMETLQNERAKRWATQMDTLGSERTKLTNYLMVTLDEIERESGIFLIKPMFSYRAHFRPDTYQGKLNRAYKPPRQGQTPRTTHVLLTTPASQHRSSAKTTTMPTHFRKPDDPTAGVAGNKTELVGDYSKPTWNPFEATTQPSSRGDMWAQVNTPRMLELDINRMLIGQNQVAMSLPASLMNLTNDRLTNAVNMSTRTYATLRRPAGQDKISKATNDRPRSHTGVGDPVPPTTPMRITSSPGSVTSSGKKVRINEHPLHFTPTQNGHTGLPKEPSEKEDEQQDRKGNSPSGSATSRTFPSTPPLPPIAAKTNDNPETEQAHDLPIPPASPPGSSIRQSPSFVRPLTGELTERTIQEHEDDDEEAD